MAGGRLEGKRALITGAGGGIGSAIARAFVGEGAKVMMSDLDGAAAQAKADEINTTTPGAAAAVAHDVTSEAAWAEALGATDEALGGFNVLVNNAGVWAVGSVEDTPLDEWRRCMSINLDSVYMGTRLAMPYLRKAQPASIVNLSSIAGIIAGHNIAAYNAAKAGVWMLTKSTALAAARKGEDIRANSIHPFFIDTGLLQDVFARGGERKPLVHGRGRRPRCRLPGQRRIAVHDGFRIEARRRFERHVRLARRSCRTRFSSFCIRKPRHRAASARRCSGAATSSTSAVPFLANRCPRRSPVTPAP